MSSFVKLLQDHRKGKLFIGRLLAFDPGETTGHCTFECTANSIVLASYGQDVCYPVDTGVVAIQNRIKNAQPDFVVYERYIVYSWKSAAHSWGKNETSQIIGSIRLCCLNAKLPKPEEQSAQEAKQFITDDKLQEWGFYIKGQKHTRDAIRHGLYWLLFHKSKPPSK